MMAVQLAFETTKRVRDIGTNRSRFVLYMNPLWHLDSTEGENDRGRATSDDIYQFSDLFNLYDALICHVIKDIRRLHLHERGMGGDPPARVHGDWNRSFNLDIMYKSELQ